MFDSEVENLNDMNEVQDGNTCSTKAQNTKQETKEGNLESLDSHLHEIEKIRYEEIIKSLEAKLKLSEENVAKISSEVQSMRTRWESQLEDTKKYAITNIAKEIIVVMDSLSMALQTDQENLDSLKKVIVGVELTKAQLNVTFTKFKIKKIEPKVGELFNCSFHQAITQVSDTGHPENTIIKVMQVGYMIEDRLLRPALVSVASQ
jgi:molecular chaperone GrpE